MAYRGGRIERDGLSEWGFIHGHQKRAEGLGFAFDGVVCLHVLTSFFSHFDRLIEAAHQFVEFSLGRGDIAAGDDKAIGAIADDVFPGSCFRGKHGGAAGHGFGRGEAKSFISA